MRRLLTGVLLAGLLLASTMLLAIPVPQSCPAGCCSGPEDCPQPICCLKQ